MAATKRPNISKINKKSSLKNLGINNQLDRSLFRIVLFQDGIDLFKHFNHRIENKSMLQKPTLKSLQISWYR